MNRSKIEWCDHTWNPITGCRHGCRYCYAAQMVKRFSGDVRMNKMAKADYTLDGDGLYVLNNPMLNETGNALVYPFGFEPTLHKYRFNTLDNLKMGNNIFVGAMADVFGEWVPDSWIDMVFNECEKRPQHNYLFLTKNPERYCKHGVPENKSNMWYGTTVTREKEMQMIWNLPAFGKSFVSMEPILEDLEPEKYENLFRELDWVILGAETGRRKDKVVPEFEWIKKIVLAADNVGVPVFMKDSLIDVVGEKNMRRDFPKELTKKTISKKMKNKLYGECNMCKAYKKKSDMVTIMGRRRRGCPVKQFAFLCEDCMDKLCKSLDVEVPDFEK